MNVKVRYELNAAERKALTAEIRQQIVENEFLLLLHKLYFAESLWSNNTCKNFEV